MTSVEIWRQPTATTLAAPKPFTPPEPWVTVAWSWLSFVFLGHFLPLLGSDRWRGRQETGEREREWGMTCNKGRQPDRTGDCCDHVAMWLPRCSELDSVNQVTFHNTVWVSCPITAVIQQKCQVGITYFHAKFSKASTALSLAEFILRISALAFMAEMSRYTRCMIIISGWNHTAPKQKIICWKVSFM